MTLIGTDILTPVTPTGQREVLRILGKLYSEYELAFPTSRERRVRKQMFTNGEMFEESPTIVLSSNQSHAWWVFRNWQRVNGVLSYLKNSQAIRDFTFDDEELSISFPEDFVQKYEEIKGQLKNSIPKGLPTQTKQNTLKGKTLTFNDKLSAITINGVIFKLPYGKNEYDLARVMFNKEIGESVDWSIIYCDMTGRGENENVETQKNKKCLQDTVNRLNKRIQERFNTTDKLLSWKDKSISRIY